MFDYQAKTEDELQLKKGDVIVILSKVRKTFADTLLWPSAMNSSDCIFFPCAFTQPDQLSHCRK